MFSSALATNCRILLDDLRAAPFSFTTGTTIRMKVFATALQGDSLPSTVVSTTMSADTCGNTLGFRSVPDVDIDIVVPPANDDDQPPVDKDDGITYVYNDGNPPSDDDDDDQGKTGLKLKVENVDAEFTSDDEKSKQYG